MILQMDDATHVIRILLFHMFEQANFNQCLLMESFLVADDFQRDHLPRLIVKAFDNLPKGSLAQCGQNLVSVPNVIIHHHPVVSTFVIIAPVGTTLALHLLFQGSAEIYLVELQDFTLFKIREFFAMLLERLRCSYGIHRCATIPRHWGYFAGVIMGLRGANFRGQPFRMSCWTLRSFGVPKRQRVATL